MEPPPPLLLENLRHRKRELDLAKERFTRQLETCIEAGYNSVQIAKQLGCLPYNVRIKRAWKERRR